MSDNFVLQIKNYQRIKSAKLEFIPGLNVIVGASNNGKSAIFRAIETALFNISRESHVTIGETKSAVGIRYNGHEIIWRRDNDAPSPMSYRVDGKILTKLGRGQPPVIAELSGIREVELDDVKMRLNFQKQMKYPFLLDKTPSQMFKFIVQSAEEDNVMEVIQTMKTDMNTILVNIKAYEEARESLRIAYVREAKRYQEMKPVVPYCNRVLEMEGKIKRYSQLKGLVSDLKGLMQGIAHDEEELKSCSEIVQELSKKISSMNGLLDRLNGLSKWVYEYKSVLESGRQFKKEYNQIVEVMKGYEGLDQRLEQFRSLEKDKERFNSLRRLVRDITELSQKEKEQELSVKDLGQRVQQQTEILDRIKIAINFCDNTQETIDNLSSLKSDIEGINEEIRTLDLEMEDTVKEGKRIQEEIDSYGVCPFCGNPIGGEYGECAGN